MHFSISMLMGEKRDFPTAYILRLFETFVAFI